MIIFAECQNDHQMSYKQTHPSETAHLPTESIARFPN